WTLRDRRAAVPHDDPSNPCRWHPPQVAGQPRSAKTLGSPYAVRLIAEKQGFAGSMGKCRSGELRNKEQVLEGQSGNCDVPTELGEVVLVALTDLLDDAVKT